MAQNLPDEHDPLQGEGEEVEEVQGDEGDESDEYDVEEEVG
jgi:hypothetical protein